MESERDSRLDPTLGSERAGLERQRSRYLWRRDIMRDRDGSGMYFHV